MLYPLAIDLAAGARRWRASRSFTLIELVATLVIVALLVAVAVPRVVDIRAQAHRAAVAMTATQFQNAIMLANITCRLRSFAGMDDLPTFGAGDLDFNSSCYPVSTSDQNVRVNPGRCAEVWAGVLSLGPSITVGGGGNADYRASGSDTTCRFTYQLDSDNTRTIEYDSATGEVRAVNP